MKRESKKKKSLTLKKQNKITGLSPKLLTVHKASLVFPDCLHHKSVFRKFSTRCHILLYIHGQQAYVLKRVNKIALKWLVYYLPTSQQNIHFLILKQMDFLGQGSAAATT